MPLSGKAGGPDLGCVERAPLEGPEEKLRDLVSVQGEKPFAGRSERGRNPLRLPREGAPKSRPDASRAGSAEANVTCAFFSL